MESSGLGEVGNQVAREREVEEDGNRLGCLGHSSVFSMCVHSIEEEMGRWLRGMVVDGAMVFMRGGESDNKDPCVAHANRRG